MKDKLNNLYQDLLLIQPGSFNNSQHLLDLINSLLENIKNPQLLGSLWKATIKTLIKLLQYSQVVSYLKAQNNFDTQQLIIILLESKFETIDQSEEEQMLLLIQKTLLKIVYQFTINEDYQFKIFSYFMKVIKHKTIDDNDSNYSQQFSDLTKKYMHKVLYHFMQQDEEHQVKSKAFEYFFGKIKKNLAKIDKKTTGVGKIREYLCFMIKTIEDCLKRINTTDELINLIVNQKRGLIETICICSECDDIMIRNQAQQLFTFLLTTILDNHIPIREELEILIIKVALKPAIQLAKKLGQQDIANKVTTPTESNQNASATTSSGNLNDSDYENEDFIQITHERTQQQDILLEMNINFLTETLLLLKPSQLAELFLSYDCQPFSENFVTKSLIMILKVAQKNPNQYMSLFQKLVSRLELFSSEKKQLIEKCQTGGPQSIQFMLEQKAQTKKLSKEANNKFKVFLQKIEDMYAYVDLMTPAEVASKILLYSREVQIDKVIEIIGGKDDRAKRIFDSYLNKLDFKESDVEQSLRKFLQTFRLAGVDSQVVMRILEFFSYKFHEKDTQNIFSNKEEAYEFVYLIIVLQTCQHNPNIKEKSSLKYFLDSANRILPLSKEHLSDEFFESVYNSVSKNPFFTPGSRSLSEESFNTYNLNETEIRLASVKQENKGLVLTESEFINSADLTQKQIFHYSNSTQVPSSLIPQAIKHLLNFLTQRFIKYSLVTHASPQNQSQELQSQTQLQPTQVSQKFQILYSLAILNKSFHNYDLVDKLFQVMYKSIHHHTQDDKLHQQLEQLLWDNFECIKRSLVLLPKLSVQSFMKEDIKGSLTKALDSVMRLIKLRQQESKKTKGNAANQEQQVSVQGVPLQQQRSFFDLVYNYFTDNTDEENKDEKNNQNEIEIAESVRKKILMEDKEGDYMEYIEERFDEKTGKQWIKESSRLFELTGLICGYIKDNMNQEEGILCLAFLEHIISNVDNNLESIEKIWVELHILLNHSLKTKPLDPLALQLTISQKEDSKTEYEVISTDTSQDSMDQSSHMQPELDLFIKDTCSIKTKILEATSRHLIMALHLKVSKQVMQLKQENSHVIRDIQRIISVVVEGDNNDKNYEKYKIFDDLFILDVLQTIVNEAVILKNYPKISKLIRLMLILILKSMTKKIEGDERHHDLVLQQLKFFQGITHYLIECSSLLPYDLIELSIDVLQKITLTQNQNPNTEKILAATLQILDNLVIALQRHRLISDESKYEIWFNIIHLLQEKVLFNPQCKRFELVSIQVFNITKNAILNHPFEIAPQNFKQIRKLFSDILFWQTFKSLSLEQVNDNPYEKEKSGGKIQEESKKQLRSEIQDQEYENEFQLQESQLEQICQICVNNLSDVFIYYIAIIFKDPISETSNSENVQEESHQSSGNETAQKLFTYLWLNLLKVLLDFAEKANVKDFHGLISSVHDNIKRVMEFLIQQGIISENHKSQEMAKLWKTSWEIISAFFTEMKKSIEETPESQ